MKTRDVVLVVLSLIALASACADAPAYGPAADDVSTSSQGLITLHNSATPITGGLFVSGGGGGSTGGVTASYLSPGATSMCLDIRDANPGNAASLMIHGCHGGWNQDWVLTQAGEIRNPQANRCLDVAVHPGAPADTVQMYDCHGRVNQAWTLLPGGYIQSRHNLRCLRSNGLAAMAPVALGTCPLSSVPPPSTGYIQWARGATLLRNDNAQRCLDVNGASTAEDAVLQTFECHGNSNQKWRFGAYENIIGSGSNKCVDVKDGATANRSRAVIKTCNGSTSQRWRRSDAGQLIHVPSGRCLDVDNAATGNNGVVQISDCRAAGANQHQLWGTR